MPRPPRIHIESGLYYVTSRGAHNTQIFKNDEDSKMYLELLKKYKDQYGFKVFSFLLMPNQLNLLIELSEGTTISMIMHDVNSSYTKYFNNRYSRKGHVFRERFKSVVVEKDKYLLDLITFIHNTPVRMGIVESEEAYKFSSHQLYAVAKRPNDDSRELEKILSLREEISEAAKMLGEIFPEKSDYVEFAGLVAAEEMEKLAKNLKKSSVLGSKGFTEDVMKRAENGSSGEPEEEKKSSVPAPAVAVTLVIALSTATVGALYVQKTIASRIALREQELYDRQIRFFEKLKKEHGDEILTDLNRTEWEIELKPRGDSGKDYSKYDRIYFDSGKITSRNLTSKGFASSNYTLTIRDDGTLVWETMQKSEHGDTVYWRGEQKDGKMKGVFSRQSADNKLQTFSFKSLKYNERK
jgi:REP element-mobilizing transposase RayT